MATKNKTWVSILIAAIVIVVVFAIAVVGSSAYFISRHIHSQFASTESAEEQFTRARARFVGQAPLIELNHDDRPIVHHPPAETPRSAITALHAVVYNSDSRKLVTVSVPMWVVRMMPSHKRFSFVSNDVEFDSSRAHLTLEDVERHGPGLILDGRSRDGDRVLIWAE